MSEERDQSASQFNPFSYDAAFGINYGLLSETDQANLKNTTLCILGMCAGGTMAVMLARAGIEKFILIDPNKYQLSDMNRDAGCFMDTLGEFKAEAIKAQLMRINPNAKVSVITEALTLEEVGGFIDLCDVFLSQSDDLALSVHAMLLAQSKRKLCATCMPSGMTAYVEIYPPDMKHVIDPAALFGSPKNLSYRQLYYFLRSPLNRCGRRWHITEGKWRVEWFQKWRDGKVFETQLCPVMWMGAALTCAEVIKQLTAKWDRVKVPRMWHLRLAENRIRVGKYRRRSWWFEKFILWTFSIEWMGIGRKYQKYTAERLMRELDEMANQEAKGEEIKLPLMWRLI
jgi:hypothetical protein